MSAAPIEIEGVSHWFGEGTLRRQILFDVSAVIHRGEIVIVSGPSGSGKTTLLTLIGALRSTQSGSLRVLDRELRGANERTLTGVRKSIGYVFQSHNLIDALTVRQNIEMGLQLHDPSRELGNSVPELSADALLESVHLAGLGDRRPSELSGGQRQRVAIARALAAQPRIILADEPTASLDRDTGRQIVTLLQGLAREHGATVLIVTHDTRILDVADRILALEDGRISSFMSAVTRGTRHLWGLLAHDLRQAELVQRVHELPAERFIGLLEQLTEETGELLQMIELAQSETFDSALSQVLEAFALKLGEAIGADRTRVYLIDPNSDELFSLVPDGEGATQEIRGSVHRGIVGRSVRTATAVRVDSASLDPDFDEGIDGVAPSTAELVALPLLDADRQVFAVIALGRRSGRPALRNDAVERAQALATSLSLLLQAWSRMSCSCRKPAGPRDTSSCCELPDRCPHTQSRPDAAVSGAPMGRSPSEDPR